ncbi:MAG: T9SS type A sorting domain-containing protein, partial [Ignavibacteriaceae bacterium]
GLNWGTSNKGIENSSVTSFVQLGSNIFIGTDGTWIYYTSDNGKNWYQRKTNLPDSQIESLSVLKGILYAGTFNSYVYSSSDNGMTWQPFSNGLNDPTIFALTANDSCVYAGSISLGIFKLSYGSTTWLPVNNGFPSTPAYCIDVKGDTIVAGTQFDGVFVSFNSGDNWLHRTSNLPRSFDNNINSVSIHDSLVFVGIGFNGLYYSKDWGLTWNSVDSGFFTTQQVVAFTAKGDQYYAGLSEVGISRSLNKGQSWKLFNSNLPKNIFPTKFYWDGSYLFLGLFNSSAYPGGLYRLAPEDSSWVEMNLGINNPSINDIVSGHGRIFAATNNGIFYSIDTSNTWYHSNPNLPFSQVNSLTIVPNNGTLISSSELGVSVSYDLGHSWVLENQGLSKGYYPNTLVLNNKFIFATTSEGVMRRPLSELVGTVGIKEKDYNNLPDKFTLEQNYPNPFNPTTYLKFSIPKQLFINIKVYDVLGRNIATLVNNIKPAGNYEIEFDGSNLSSGVYFYQIRAGEFIKTKKMLLTK